MDTTYTILTKSAQETKDFGQKMAASLMEKRNSDRLHPLAYCLYGELGSGKTTFVQGFAKELGITSRLLSPTFIIVRRYSLINKNFFLYHIDLYRINDEKDLKGLGLREIFSDPSAIILVEWAQRLGPLMPKNRIDVTFTTLGEEKRNIHINAKC